MTGPLPHQPCSSDPNCRTDFEKARSPWWFLLACGCLLLAGGRSLAKPADPTPPPTGRKASPPEAPRLPRVAPDYVDVVIPPNLAPLNLAIQEPGVEYHLRVSGARGQPIDLQQAQPQVRFPLRQWKELLGANRGGALRWNIAVRNSTGEWIPFASFENQVAEEEIDPYVSYRRLRPLYSSYKHLGIYQRHLETFDEKPIVRNSAFGQGCVNCHTPFQGAPDRFAISFRGRSGAPTLLVNSNRITRIDTKMGYLSWHPNGKLLAFADNTITQIFHIAGPVNRDIFDPNAQIKILHVDDRRVEKPAALTASDRTENWPSWAPDGRHLYYCSAPKVALRDLRNFRYDLLRISYDPDRNEWGQPETLFSGAEHSLSAHEPRVSPDGRHLVFTVSDSGTFPAFRPDSDLFLLRLDTRKVEPLPINSKQVEIWHSWSSNGRWLLFGSRRLDGVFARLFITHVDPAARFTKPLLLPQEDPAYYETCLDNFNAAEMIRGPVQISEEELARAVAAPGHVSKPTEGDPWPPDQSPDRARNQENPHQ